MRVGAHPQVDVDVVDADRALADQDFAGLRYGRVNVGELEDVGSALAVDTNRFHELRDTAGFRTVARGYAEAMERRTLYEDDLTEERDPTPAQREDVAETTELDPADDGVEDDDED